MQTVGPSLAVSLEPLAHRRNVACLILFYDYYFSKFSPFLGVTQMSISTVSFLAQLDSGILYQ